MVLVWNVMRDEEVEEWVWLHWRCVPLMFQKSMGWLILDIRPELKVAICLWRYIRNAPDVHQSCFCMVAWSALLRLSAMVPPECSKCEPTNAGEHPWQWSPMAFTA